MDKYRIFLTCYDFDTSNPYPDEIIGTYDSKMMAENVMLTCVLDELASLNGILEDDTFPERRFIATINDEEYDVVVNAWDGPDYRPVTCYKVASISELLEFFNAKLRKTYGQNITVQLHAYEEDDDSIWFYYTSAKYGKSDAYPTAREAYHRADKYLRYVVEL